MKIRRNIYHLIRILLLVLIFSQSIAARNFSPVDSVGMKNVKGKQFLLYKVEHGETWYGIGHKFDLSAKEVEAANEDLKGKPLSVGQILLIPRNGAPAIAAKEEASEAAEKPIIHKVKKNETLYSIAVSSGVTMKDIRKWNNFKTDTLQKGQKLIVGYGGMKKGKQKPATESSEPVGSPGQVKNVPEVKKDTAKAADTLKLKKENKDSVKVSAPKGRELEEHGIATFIEDEDINPHKYYALHRTAPKGTIIKVTNIMTKKQIYVKVVGTLPDTGDNNNLLIKISKASAMKLGVLDSRFQVVLNYFGE